MPPDGPRFWSRVVTRLAAVFVAGCASVLWFQGCLVPLVKDELRQDQQKAAGDPGPGR